MRALFYSAVFGSLACMLLPAQTATTGFVTGTVTDASGGAVPGASAELKDARTGIVVTKQTNAAGQYVFPNLLPGDYELKVTAAGFRAAVLSGLKVEVTKSYVHNVTLEVGQVTESVVVSASETVVELQTVDPR